MLVVGEVGECVEFWWWWVGFYGGGLGGVLGIVFIVDLEGVG